MAEELDLGFLTRPTEQQPEQPEQQSDPPKAGELDLRFLLNKKDREGVPSVPGFPPGVQALPEQSQFKTVGQVTPSGDVGGFTAFGRGVVRGMTSIGEGIRQREAQLLKALGVDTNDEGVDINEILRDLEISRGIEKAKIQPTKEESPIATGAGEIAGEVLALPIPSQGLKTAVAVGAGLGATQFGDKPGDLIRNSLIGAGFGALGEGVSNLATKTIEAAGRKLGFTRAGLELFDDNGALTTEAAEAFENAGVSLDDLSDQVLKAVEDAGRGADIEQALRVAEAENLGVTALTRADVTQDFKDQSLEFTLSRQRGTNEDKALRQLQAEKNQQITEAGNVIKNNIGGQENKIQAGQTIQDALRASKTERRQVVRELYETAEAEAGEAFPVGQEKIARVFGDQDFEFGADPDLAGQLKGVRRQLEIFGVLPPDGIKPEDLFRIKSLTVGNAEKLRQNINTLIPVSDPRSQAILGPIRDSIDDAIFETGLADNLAGEARTAFLNARQAHRKLKQDFDAKDIVNNIVAFKPGTGTDQIPPSLVVDKILKGAGRFENVKLIKRSLLGAGEEGKEAWANIKTTAISDILGKSLKTGKTAAGDFKFSGANYNRALEDIGKDTLKQLFDPKELAAINQLRRVTRDLTILQDGVFTPSGAHVENTLSRISKLPMFNIAPLAKVVVGEAAEQVSKGKRRATFREVINPEISRDAAQAIGLMETVTSTGLRLIALSGLRKATDREEAK